jgi:uncharacterized membrane protein YciS (DUF1049 family)
MGFIAGFIIGAVVASIVFIIWGRKNKNKIERAREAIINNTNEISSTVKSKLQDILN